MKASAGRKFSIQGLGPAVLVVLNFEAGRE